MSDDRPPSSSPLDVQPEGEEPPTPTPLDVQLEAREAEEENKAPIDPKATEELVAFLFDRGFPQPLLLRLFGRVPGRDADLRRPEDPHDFCFVRRRMRIVWREADRRADASGRAVDRTIGASRARRDWFLLLELVLGWAQIVRIRHIGFDEPAILIRESEFRSLEAAAEGAAVEETAAEETAAEETAAGGAAAGGAAGRRGRSGRRETGLRSLD